MIFVLKLYALLLRLYPPAFQRRFGEEMQDVFSESLEEAQRAGPRQQITHVFKEIIDFPRGLSQIYFAPPQPMLTTALELLSSDNPTRLHQPRPTWVEALLGGLPQFLIGLLAGLPTLLAAAGLLPSVSAVNSIVIGIALICLVGSVVLFFKLGRPLWSATWYFYWFMIGLSAFGMIFDQFQPQHEWAEVASYPTWATLLAITVCYGLYRIAAQDRLRGVLAAVPISMVLWVINLEFVPDGPEGINWLATSLLAGLFVILILRANRPGVGILLAVLLTALVGLPYSYLGTYLGGTLPFTEPGPSLRAVWNSYTPMLGVTATLVLGPQLAVTLRELGRRCGGLGITAYRTALGGMLLAIMGAMLLVFTVTSNAVPILRTIPAAFTIRISLVLGCLVFTVGFFLLLSALHRSLPQLIGAVQELTLFFSILGVPFVILTALSAVGMLHNLPSWLPNALRPSSETLIFISVWFHVIWVPLSSWTALAWLKRLSSAGESVGGSS